MALMFQYVPMNFVGVLGPETDVLKTGGVGTCVAIAIQYRLDEELSQYRHALAHVPFDSNALTVRGQAGVDDYMDCIFACLGDPSEMSVRVIENTSNRLTPMIVQKLEEHERVLESTLVSYSDRALPRMNVVILRKKSEQFGKLFCYASNKTEFIDESETAKDALGRGMNMVSLMDVMKRHDKHDFRRHVDLYAQARRSLGSGYAQHLNPYALALEASANKGFSPVLAGTDTFTRAKTEPWTKKRAKPPVVEEYLTWENRIAGRVLRPVPAPWSEE
jgi:hypothetical protein